MNLVLILLILLIVVFLAVFVIGYNRIVNLEEECKRAWRDIDVWLKNAYSVISNLVNVVKNAYGAESQFYKQLYETFEKISENYSKYVSSLREGDFSKSVENAKSFYGVMFPIILQLPSFPEVPNEQFSKEFEKLHTDVKTAIEKITYARQFYNQAVLEYNAFIKRIPWNFIASLMGKKEYPYWELEESERKMIEGKLDSGELTKDII